MLRGATRRTFWVVWVCLLLARTSAADARAIVADVDGDGLRDRATVVRSETEPSVAVWLWSDAATDSHRRDALIADDDSSQSLPEDVAPSTPVGVALTEVVQARAPAVTAATIRSADVGSRSPSLASPLAPRPPPSR
jgi:hypothetical protein